MRRPVLFIAVAALTLIAFGAGWMASRRQEVAPVVAAAPATAEIAIRATRPPPATVGLPLPPINPRARWASLAARPATIERDAEMAETLSDLVEVDAEKAGRLLELLSEADRLRLGAAILWDAAREPARAVRLGLALCRADPRCTADYGYALAGALTRLGEFQAAVDFATTMAAASQESEEPGKWTRAIFAEWAARDPRAAARAAGLLAQEGLRGEALAVVAAR